MQNAPGLNRGRVRPPASFRGAAAHRMDGLGQNSRTQGVRRWTPPAPPCAPGTPDGGFTDQRTARKRCRDNAPRWCLQIGVTLIINHRPPRVKVVLPVGRWYKGGVSGGVGNTAMGRAYGEVGNLGNPDTE